MILIEKTEVSGFETAIRAMRNLTNSWDQSDSGICKGGDSGIGCKNCINNEYGLYGCEHAYDHSFQIGAEDYILMNELAYSGAAYAKYRRMIIVYADITAPLYWWKGFDTYKVGIVAKSCSTIHKIYEKEFTLDDFSHDQLVIDGEDLLKSIIRFLNAYRLSYLETKNELWWWQMVQLLPSSYNQKRTVMLNYEVLSNIYAHTYNKFNEWREFCIWMEGLPWSEICCIQRTAKHHFSKENRYGKTNI